MGEHGHDVAELVAALGCEARVAEHFIIDALTRVTAGECIADPTSVARRLRRSRERTVVDTLTPRASLLRRL